VNDEARGAVVDALALFLQAKRDLELTFSAGSASEIVSAVLKGQKTREGHTLNGLEYFVHGIGYTVVMSSGGNIHFDSGDRGEGDVFSAHDIQFFLETSGRNPVPAIDEIKSVLNDLNSSGILSRYGNRFGVHDPSHLIRSDG
jgi:hypothetical protein